MKQIGNLPRFFHPEKRKQIANLSIEAWPGF